MNKPARPPRSEDEEAEDDEDDTMKVCVYRLLYGKVIHGM
jgi:hypothetical protein